MATRSLLLITAAVLLALAVPTDGEVDLQALSLEYGYDLVEGEVPITLVESGRDNGTQFRYLILDDYSEAPENWSQPGFNDSNWSFGGAPFGDREYNNVDPNTDWDTDGSSPYENDILLVRHRFDRPAGTLLSAEINVAFANYCTPYLNGNLIYSERGGNSHGAEYWNGDGTESLAPELFNRSGNLLAIYARDYVYGSGGQNRQWLDLQITGGIDAPLNTTTEPVTLGDRLTLALEVANEGNATATNATITLQVDGETMWQQFLPSVAANANATILVDWTPHRLGDIPLNLSISSESNESNYLNNSLEIMLHIHHWGYALEYGGVIPVVNSTLVTSLNITVRNTGDLPDVLTFATSERPTGWDIDYLPGSMSLAPGESGELLVSVEVSSMTTDGEWNFSIETTSQNSARRVSFPLVQSGRTAATEWSWTNSTNTSQQLYDNLNWTLPGFNDSGWRMDGAAPFGDNSISGVNYNTEWDGDNYAYFRHAFNVSNLDIYTEGVLTLSIATNGAGAHYINGNLIFSDLGGGDHGAQYWNREELDNTNALLEGENVLASVVRNNQNTQWYDERLDADIRQANYWNFHPQPLSISVLLDTKAPSSLVEDQGGFRNSTEVEINWRLLANATDLAGFRIDYALNNGSGWGAWEALGEFSGYNTTFSGGSNGTIYRFRSISFDTRGNVESKSTYGTEFLIDTAPPASLLRVVDTTGNPTNLTGIYLAWEPATATDNDIASYRLQLRNGSGWDTLAIYAATGEHYFTPATDGEYAFRVLATDYAGNGEAKPEADVIISFDRQRPEVTLSALPQLWGESVLALQLLGDTSGLADVELQYALLAEGSEMMLGWGALPVNWDNGSALFPGLADGRSYWFRLAPVDAAGNTASRTPYVFETSSDGTAGASVTLPVLPLKPVYIGLLANVAVAVDVEGDGSFEVELDEYFGSDPSQMLAIQFRVDYTSGTLYFGDGVDGYRPSANAMLRISYAGYDATTTIDLTPPGIVQSMRAYSENFTDVELQWESAPDVSSYRVERSGNLSLGWVLRAELAPQEFELNSYAEKNLAGQVWYYRVIALDRMGYESVGMEYLGSTVERVMVDLTPPPAVVENPTVSSSDQEVPAWLLPLVAGLALLGGGVALFASRRSAGEAEVGPSLETVDALIEPVPVVEAIPEEEEPELGVFSVVSGTEYSRHVRFRCQGGCDREFPGLRDEEEIVCPHCGTLGPTPELP
ncbi:MAG: CARDB domain-containing protein [Candidatus Poseidoniia archaeon]|jgi:hypothetical protein|nr:CARDB domain-containing protein [Candidatus Poseidoniia archaeon]HJP43796.1 CARDB domain-containing protein [Candidatus Poseidoniia archaeon]